MTDTRPNILLFTTDQHRGDHVGLAGHECVETPNLDAWINQGAYFPNAYTEIPSTTGARRVLLSGRRRPRVLLIPTASHDGAWAYDPAIAAFETQGARPETLLLADPPDAKTRREKIAAADIVWVSGGNTLKMMRRWRHLGVDRLLTGAMRRGTVLSGSSAGAICWCAFGHSDSMADYHPDDWEYIRVRGLGCLPITFCPHYGAEGRQASFRAMIARHGGVGIAADEFCGLEVIGRKYRVLSTRRGARAYRVTRRRGEVFVEPLAAANSMRPLATLLAD